MNRSKYLCYLLRHHPESVGLKIINGGWARLDDLIKLTDFTLEEINEIVRTDNKGRYKMTNELIKCNHGHSIKIDLYYSASIPPHVLYHGTDRRFLDSIMENGINSQSRQYVHLSEKIEEAKSVGKRHGNNLVVLEIDADRMFVDGCQFYLSDDGVWLTDYVSTKYFKEIEV